MPENEIPVDQQSVYLVVPYFSGDIGRPGIERPLPTATAPGVISWACPSIKVGGTPGTFTPGEPLSVTVTVANNGAGTGVAIVNVAVWWADPSTAFTLTHLHGQSVIAVPSRGGIVTTKPIVNVIPATAPSHICLLVRVSSPADAPSAGAPIDPVNDRHWAQLNLNAVPAPGGAFQFSFWAGNPLERECRFTIGARPVGARGLEQVAGLMRSRPIALDEIPADLLFLDDEGRPSEEPFHGEVVLQPGERRRLLIGGQVPATLAREEFAALEIVQSCDERVIGSIGLVLVGESDQ